MIYMIILILLLCFNYPRELTSTIIRRLMRSTEVGKNRNSHCHRGKPQHTNCGLGLSLSNALYGCQTI